MGLGFSLKRSLGWVLGNYTPRKTLPDTSLVSLKELADFVATMQAELDRSNLFDGPVVSNSAPVNTVAPVISGTSSVGSVLTATSGTWTGVPTPTLAGQWFRGASAISGATGTTYTIVSGDVGQAIRYRQTATNVVGSASADSNSITATTATTWILAGGVWNDAGTWDDNAVWNDGESNLASDYASRVSSAGGTLTGEGLALVAEIFDAASDHGVAVTSGWVFGSEVNATRSLQINLVSGKPSIVPVGTLNAATTLSKAMLGVRTEGNGTDGYKSSDDLGLIDNTPNHSVMMLITYAPNTPLSGAGPMIFKQSNSPSFAGNIECYGSAFGGITLIDRPATSAGFPGAVTGGSQFNREVAIDTQMGWFHLNGSGTAEMIHANGEKMSWSFAGNPGSKPLFLANADSSTHAGDVGFAMLIRFDGALSDADREDIFTRVYAKWRAIGTSVLIVGNSVTIPSGVANSWPHRMQKWGVHNSAVFIRRAQGARRLPFFAPTGYTLPPAVPDDFIALMSIDILDWFAANLVINDDQQNMVASGQPWSSWLHCHNAIVAHCQALNDLPVRAVMCTQIAHAPYTFGSPPSGYQFLPYPAFGNSNWRQVSIATRAATLADFANVKTAVADVWTAFNLGYPTDVDGTPNDPLNDFANGNTALFLPNDAQHPNEEGHLVMYNLYRDAVERVLAL